MTANKILQVGFYWPTLFGDTYKCVRSCQKCQLFAQKKRLAPLPLIPVFIKEPFRQWGFDFVREINPPSSGQHKWVLTATDYFTKWVEAIPTRKANDQNVILSLSIAYHLHGNGLVESTNKTLMKILKKTIVESQRDWDSKLKFSLWATRVTSRISIGKSPFKLVYGTQALFPSQLVKPVIAMIQEAKEEPNSLIRIMNKVVELSENMDKVRDNLIMYQSKMKSIFDRKAKEIDFKVADLVLRWDTRRGDKGKHGKFDPLWYGPFRVVEARSNKTFILENIDGEILQLPVNG
eukprot:PITA_29859